MCGSKVAPTNGRFLVNPEGRVLGMDSFASEVLLRSCEPDGPWFASLLKHPEVSFEDGNERLVAWGDHKHHVVPFVCHFSFRGTGFSVETRQLHPIGSGATGVLLCGSVERRHSVPRCISAAHPRVSHAIMEEQDEMLGAANVNHRASSVDGDAWKRTQLKVFVDARTGGLQLLEPWSEEHGGSADTPLDSWRQAKTLAAACDAMSEPGRSEFELSWRELRLGRLDEFYTATLMHYRGNEDQLVHIHICVTDLDSLGYPTQVLVWLRVDGAELILADDEIAEGIKLMRHVRESLGATDLRGRIRYWSRGAEELYGWRASEVIGRPMSEVIRGEEEFVAENEGLQHALTHGSWAGCVRHRRKDGSRFFVDAHISLIRSSTGKPLGFVGLGRDATQRIEAERRASELQTRLQRVGWMGVKVEMLAGISHELNQPLYSIQNYASAANNLLARGQWETLEEVIAAILGEVKRAGIISERMRQYARSRELRLERISLEQTARACVECLEPLIQSVGARVIWRMRVRESLVRGDRLQLHQTISNLIRNACEAMGEVETATVHRLEITLEGEQEQMILRIRDSGPGVAKCDRERIFDIFYTTKQEGTGVGLALSRSVVNQHGGELRLVDTSPSGTEFEVRLPGVSGPAGRA